MTLLCDPMDWSQRRQWYPTPVLLPGKSHGWRSLVGCGPWGHIESDTTEWFHFHFSLSCIGEGNGNPLQCSCLENPRDGRAWWAAVYGVEQSQTRLKRLSSSSMDWSTPVHYFSLSPRACSNPCPSSRWCHPAISSSVIPFSYCPQSFPASGSFPLSQLFASDGQSIGAWASPLVLLMNIQDWFPLGWTGCSPCSPRDSQEPSPALSFKSITTSVLSLLYVLIITSKHDYWKSQSFD